MQAFDPTTQEAEAGESLISRPAWFTKWVLGQLGLYRDSVLKNKNKKQSKTKQKQKIKKKEEILINSALKRQRHVDLCEFEVSLVYIMTA